MRITSGMVAVVVSLGGALYGCGGGSSPSSPTIPTVPTVSKANITLTPVAVTPVTVTMGTETVSPLNRRFTATMVESAGLGANINYARVRMTSLGVEVLRGEIDASSFSAQTGSNRLNAYQSQQVSLYFSDVNEGTIEIEINFTDDKSNEITASLSYTF